MTVWRETLFPLLKPAANRWGSHLHYTLVLCSMSPRARAWSAGLVGTMDWCRVDSKVWSEQLAPGLCLFLWYALSVSTCSALASVRHLLVCHSMYVDMEVNGPVKKSARLSERVISETVVFFIRAVIWKGWVKMLYEACPIFPSCLLLALTAHVTSQTDHSITRRTVSMVRVALVTENIALAYLSFIIKVWAP